LEAPNYLAFDPGVTVGWAAFNEQGQLIAHGQVDWIDLIDFLRTIDVSKLDKIILEEYKVFHKKAKSHIGSKLETTQAIGKIKAWAELNLIDVVEQPANILPIAQMWTQIKMPSDHSVSHSISATLHGFYWLIKNKIAKTALEEEYARNQESRTGSTEAP
jgi:hypothetical protein